MSLIHLDGFDQFSNITQSDNITNVLNSSGYESLASGANSIIFGEGTDIGTTGIQVEQKENVAVSYLQKTVTASNLTVFGFAFKANARFRICSIVGVGEFNWNGRNVEFTTALTERPPADSEDTSTDYNVSDTTGTGTAVPILNTWYYYEVAIDKVATEVRFYINGRLDMTVSNFDTDAEEYIIRWGWKYNPSFNPIVKQQVDDFYVVTGDGERLNDVLGPIKVNTRFATENRTTEWTSSNDELEHWELVSQRPPRSDYYVQSNTSGAADIFGNTEDFTVDGSILAVGVVARAMKTDIDDREIGLVIDVDGTRKEIIDPDMSTDFKYHMAFFDTDVNGEEWTVDKIKATGFGVIVRP